MEGSNEKSWVATLVPHRSLSRQGFLAVMGLIAGANFIAGAVFFAIGAWPVMGFCGLDVLIMWWAFRRNFADAQRAERIEITGGELLLDRLAEGLETTRQRFTRRWVRVELDEDEARELIGGLYLSMSGRRTEIAAFLAPSERKEFAAALRSAIANPHF